MLHQILSISQVILFHPPHPPNYNVCDYLLVPGYNATIRLPWFFRTSLLGAGYQELVYSEMIVPICCSYTENWWLDPDHPKKLSPGGGGGGGEGGCSNWMNTPRPSHFSLIFISHKWASWWTEQARVAEDVRTHHFVIDKPVEHWAHLVIYPSSQAHKQTSNHLL